MKSLDWKEKQNTTYAAPLWLRDQQIQTNISKVRGRIQPPTDDHRSEPCAVVGFGPSLNDIWEQIRNFKVIFSCSGAHKVLIERGIVPTYHAEVDPRPHKIELLGPPHKDVTYLIASTCSPALLDHLSGFNVLLWHVFDGNDDGWRLLPQGEWAVTGGCDVGLRSITLAAFLGYRDLHIFGIDGCARDNVRHAADHPHKIKDYSACEYEGMTYWTTPGMLESARQVWHELDQIPAVKATFYGEGLVQAMAKNYVRKESPGANIIGFSKPELISEQHRGLNADLHGSNPAYGVGGSKHAPVIIKLVGQMQLRSVLDYGCGKGLLSKALPFPIWNYDPSVPQFSENPRPAELTICTDVLEHIEPDKLRFVLNDLARCTKRLAYLTIHTGPAAKTYANGENTHLIQRDSDWWKNALSEFFHVGIVEQLPLLYILAVPKQIDSKYETANKAVLQLPKESATATTDRTALCATR